MTNVVFMGMGEPLANFRALVQACAVLIDDLGFQLSRRRVTVSTSGLVPQIRKLAQETNAALAVSLHAPDDELRNVLVPINRRHPIAELLEACWDYAEATNAVGITFEYVMLSGVNDSESQARQLAKLLVNRPAKVNLIPFNPFPGSDYRRSTPEAPEPLPAGAARCRHHDHHPANPRGRYRGRLRPARRPGQQPGAGAPRQQAARSQWHGTRDPVAELMRNPGLSLVMSRARGAGGAGPGSRRLRHHVVASEAGTKFSRGRGAVQPAAGHLLSQAEQFAGGPTEAGEGA